MYNLPFSLSVHWFFKLLGSDMNIYGAKQNSSNVVENIQFEFMKKNILPLAICSELDPGWWSDIKNSIRPFSNVLRHFFWKWFGGNFRSLFYIGKHIKTSLKYWTRAPHRSLFWTAPRFSGVPNSLKWNERGILW